MPDIGDDRLHAVEEMRFVERHFREQDDMRRIARGLAGQSGRSGQPAGMSAHHFVDEDLGGGVGHRRDVERRFGHRHRGVFRCGTEAGTAVGQHEVVVHRLRHADAGQRVTAGLGQAREFQRRIGRIVAAVVEEPAHVVGAEHVDQALVLGAVGLERLEFDAAGTEDPAGRMRKRPDLVGRQPAGVHQFLAQDPEDAVATGQDPQTAAPGRLDDRTGGGVDDSGHAPGLGVEERSFAHKNQALAVV